jgi:hypothetical protein
VVCVNPPGRRWPPWPWRRRSQSARGARRWCAARRWRPTAARCSSSLPSRVPHRVSWNSKQFKKHSKQFETIQGNSKKIKTTRNNSNQFKTIQYTFETIRNNSRQVETHQRPRASRCPRRWRPPSRPTRPPWSTPGSRGRGSSPHWLPPSPTSTRGGGTQASGRPAHASPRSGPDPGRGSWLPRTELASTFRPPRVPRRRRRARTRRTARGRARSPRRARRRRARPAVGSPAGAGAKRSTAVYETAARTHGATENGPLDEGRIPNCRGVRV